MQSIILRYLRLLEANKAAAWRRLERERLVLRYGDEFALSFDAVDAHSSEKKRLNVILTQQSQTSFGLTDKTDKI